MDINELLKIVRRWWWLALIPVLVVGVYVAATYRAPGTSYQVVMRFAAGTSAAGHSEDYDRYYAWLTSEYIANGLADVAETRAFAEAVAGRLAEEGLDVAAPALQNALATDNSQSILIVYLTWPNVDRVTAVANAVAAEIVENGATYYPQMRDLSQAARLLDPPNPVPLAPSLRARLLGPGLKLLLAGVGGIGLMALAHYLDPVVRASDELEALEIAVLGRIPR